MSKTINSVLNQTFDDFEFIVIDGGSNDGGIDVIKQYKDKIDYWVSEPDKGVYNAMNKGIAKAVGDYLLFLNSGDYLCSNTILKEVFDTCVRLFGIDPMAKIEDVGITAVAC